MNPYTRLRRTPSTFRPFPGLTVVAFDKRPIQLRPALAARRAKARRSRPRKRTVGAGRKPKWTPPDRLFVTLTSYRVCVSQAFPGGPRPHPRAEGDGRRGRVDGGLRGRHRPALDEAARDRAPGGGGAEAEARPREAAVGKAAAGKTHDERMYDRSRPELSDGVRGTGDSGYQGTDLEVPHKRPRGGMLSGEQRASNRRLSKRRIVVGHGIGKRTIWRIVADRFRNPRRTHAVVMKTMVGLRNLMFSWAGRRMAGRYRNAHPTIAQRH